MTFLPIVERELRAAARRKSTYRIRLWTAVVAMAASYCGLALTAMARGSTQVGSTLFTVGTSYAFGLCLLAGVFLTADCLSEEKREGTLGLLFLTDLKGYDVVLGKLMGRSVNAFYGLLAVLPILGLPLLLGGVTGGEFWRMTIALMNALLVSLAAGVCVSALSQEAPRAMGGTLALVILLAGGLPALAKFGSLFRHTQGWSYVALISPLSPFVHAREGAYAGQRSTFWSALIASQALGWTFIVLAGRALPRLWQERDGRAGPASLLGRWLKRGRGSLAQRKSARAELLAMNPVLWLVGEEPAVRRLVWGIVGGWAAVVCIGGCLDPNDWMWVFVPAEGFGFVLKMVVAAQACRFFGEGRRNGVLEMVVCTPLRNGEILKGQWLALRGLFFRPVMAFLLLSFLPFGFRIYFGMSRASITQFWDGLLSGALGAVVIGWHSISVVADILAVCWFGMWVALSTKKPSQAVARTILFVLVLPGLAFCEVFPPLSFCSLSILADLFFILWGSSKLQQDFRWLLANQYQPGRGGPAPQTTLISPLPPVIVER